MQKQVEKIRHIHVKFFENEDEVPLKALLPQSAEGKSHQEQFLSNVIFHVDGPAKRSFVLMESSQVEYLKQKVAVLENDNQRMQKLEEEMRYHMSIIKNLERRTQLHHFNPGPFKQLILNAENNPFYKIYGNVLLRRPSQEKWENSLLSYSIVSNQPLSEDQSHFSFQITITDTPEAKSRAFIGLCTIIPQGILPPSDRQHDAKTRTKFIIPKGSPQQIERQQFITRLTKKTLCDLYYQQRSGLNRKLSENIALKKGDQLVMTVDLEQHHITWYRNKICLERSYYKNPLTNMYPFVYLEPNVEVSF